MFGWLRSRKKAALFLIGYTFFGLLMFLLFFYLTFPFSLLESRWVQSLERESGCKIDVGLKKVHFPLRSVWSGILVACPGAFPALNIELIDATVAPLPLFFSRRAEIDFLIKAAGGEVTGRLTAAQKPEGLSFSLKENGKQLHLAAPDGGWSGGLDVAGEASWSDRNIGKGKGRFMLNLEGVRLRQVGPWAIPIGEITFSKGSGKVQWGGGMVTLEQWTAQGSQLDLLGGGGTLLLQESLDRSLLNLTFQLVPKGELKQLGALLVQGVDSGAWSLGVKGPLTRPQISLNGKPITP